MNTTYTVVIGYSSYSPKYCEIPNLSKWQACREARMACKDHPTLPVYVRFFRESDGCKGYLNSKGDHDFRGRNWNIHHDNDNDDQEDDKSVARKKRREKYIPKFLKNGLLSCKQIITHKNGTTDISMVYYGSLDSLRDDKTLHDALSGLLIARTTNAVTGGYNPSNYNNFSKFSDSTIQQVYWQTVIKIEIFGPNGIYKYACRNGKNIDEGFTSADC